MQHMLLYIHTEHVVSVQCTFVDLIYLLRFGVKGNSYREMHFIECQRIKTDSYFVMLEKSYKNKRTSFENDPKICYSLETEPTVELQVQLRKILCNNFICHF